MVTVPILSKTKIGGKLSLKFDGHQYSRLFHYKRDAQVYAEEVNEAIRTYGEMFHPDMVHMYLVEEEE